MARPTKLKPELQDRVVQAIKAGNYAEIACRAVGIAPSTFYRWLERGEREPDGIYYDFTEAVRRAEAESEVHAVAIVRREMSGDWRAAVSYLERRHPRRWRRQQATELTGRDGGPIRTEQAPGLDLTKLSEAELAQLEEICSRAAVSD